jgi:hypothetical protein
MMEGSKNHLTLLSQEPNIACLGPFKCHMTCCTCTGDDQFEETCGYSRFLHLFRENVFLYICNESLRLKTLQKKFWFGYHCTVKFLTFYILLKYL